MNVLKKEIELRRLIRSMDGVIVAFSGGVDSSFLALSAKQELGERALAITGLSPSVAAEHRERAERVSESHNISHRLVTTNEIEDPDYVKNDTSRCFFCKNELYSRLRGIADEEGVEHILDGTNADDLSGHRPGLEAARLYSVRSPLAELGFTKEEIRAASKALGLETWEIPASPCLASRIQYGIPVTIERLGKVEKGEALLRDLGFREFRLRNHGDLARLEFAPEELARANEISAENGFLPMLTAIGFSRVVVDKDGFRSGSMNEPVNQPETGILQPQFDTPGQG